MSVVDFVSPSFRQGSADLTIQVSPLGLVELADEEFEVHGQRISRYAQAMAFYLGNHWAYMRPLGESQLTFNYARAMVDYINNFCFGKGIHWTVPRENEAIVPSILERIWHHDNNEARVLWEMGQMGGVTGDCFLKVAYEDAWTDSAGNFHPGRVRLLPLNPSFCFPEWHPHDKDRMIRFKLKYRFWGTLLDGTRQVFTYTEIISDDEIAEYINDQLIDAHPNPLGEIPIVHSPNTIVTSSPWGLPDLPGDFLTLNRQYNETATQLADIINYHAAPTTVIIGAKAASLEKSATKVWANLPKEAKVMNLEMQSDADLAQAFMSLLKQAMHEMAGVPVTALGQEQSVSNTSGVALQIQYQPLMMRFNQKTVTYGYLYERANYFALKTLALKEPELFVYDPETNPELKDGQLDQMDLRDPMTYRTKAHFQSSLPIDVLIKLNEIVSKMQLGLESKRGALKTLGEEHPDEKLEELMNELFDDARNQGLLDLFRAQIMDAISLVTMSGGAGPDGAGQPGGVASAGGPQVNTATGPSGASSQNGNGDGGGQLPGAVGDQSPLGDLLQQLTEYTGGTKLAQYRNPNKND